MTIQVWLLRAGARPTDGWPSYRVGLEQLIAAFGLSEDGWISDPSSLPRLGERSRLFDYTEPSHVICKIDGGEGTSRRWKPGFYRIDIEPVEIVRLLGRPQNLLLA